MTQAQVRKDFWTMLQIIAPELYAKGKIFKRQNEQITDIRIYFCDFLEHLYNDGDITEKQRNNFTL